MTLRIRLLPIRGAFRTLRRTSRVALVLALGVAALVSATSSALAASTGSPHAASTGARPAVPTVRQDWKLLAPPAPTDAILLNSTCVDAWDCWSAGAIIGNGNNNNTFVAVAEHWDGTSWSSVATQRPGKDGWLFTDVTCAGTDDCWAVGAELNQGSSPQPLAERWDGSSWSIVETPTVAGYLLGVSCSGAGSCFAVGSRTSGQGNPVRDLMEHWNGSSWEVVSLPPTGQSYSSLSSVSCPELSECFAVGWDGPNAQNTGFLPIYPAEADGQGLIYRWDGSSWSTIANPGAVEGSYLSGVTCVTPDDCWSAGADTNTAGFAKTALIDHWNGASWETTPVSGFADPGGDFLHQVSCVGQSYCLATGSSGLGQGLHQGVEPAVAVWNGTAWSGTSVTGSYLVGMLEGIACAGRADCFTTGFHLNPSGNNLSITTLVEQLHLPEGYRLAASDGGTFNFGADDYRGSMAGRSLIAPVVAAASPDAEGYWLAGSDGGVFSFGDATFNGSMGGKHLVAPVVGIACDGDRSYWLVASDGGVFSFGDAGFHGSASGKRLAAPIVGIAATPDGEGYWLVGSDGGVFSFGDAGFHGSAAGKNLAAPIVGIAATPDGEGYWLVASDGGVFSFGDAGFHGSAAAEKLAAPIVGIAATPDGEGYWLVASDGGVFSFGDAGYSGSEAGKGLVKPVVAGA